MPSLKLEFSRFGTNNTILDDQKIIIKKTRETILANCENWKLHERLPYYDDALDNDVWHLAKYFASEMIVEDKMEHLDDYLLLYGRCFTIQSGAYELRKKIVPYIKGPQHNGSEAQLPFYEKVVEILKIKEKEDVFDS